MFRQLRSGCHKGREITWMAEEEEENREGRTARNAGEERMTRNPIYDYPEPYANPRSGAPSSPRKISLVGRLRLTQPVWLQLGINSATALHILQREPPGTFLVRRSNTRQCQVLSLRLPDNSSPAFVTTYRLDQERAVIFLEGSDRTFPSLLHLIASYCSTPDILPLSLRLPRAIWEASSCQQLEAIAHLGLEFWNSSLNTKEFDNPAPLVLPSIEDADSPLDPKRDANVGDSTEPACREPSRTQGIASLPSDGPQHGDVGARRRHFKNNVKVQVSTEAASPLSPPAAPPPPIPIGKRTPTQFPGPTGRSQSSSQNSLPRVSSQGVAKLETYCVPRSKEKEPSGPPGAAANPLSSSGQLLSVMEEEQRELHDQASDIGHFPWDFPAQERGKLGSRVRNCALSSSAPL